MQETCQATTGAQSYGNQSGYIVESTADRADYMTCQTVTCTSSACLQMLQPLLFHYSKAKHVAKETVDLRPELNPT